MRKRGNRLINVLTGRLTVGRRALSVSPLFLDLVMNIPQELLDEIFKNLPRDDKKSLQSCSLVSKSWLEPSQRLLFAGVTIRFDDFQSWVDNISPTNIGLLRHVRALEYFRQPKTLYSSSGDLIWKREVHDPRFSVYTLRDYLPTFSQLQALGLRHMDIEPTIPQHLELFVAFQHTLSSLFLEQISITWSTFISLVGHFPHLRRLEIRKASFQVDDQPVPQLSRALRGRLLVWLRGTDSVGPFVERFPELRQEYEELEISGACDQRLISAIEANLKVLKVHDSPMRTLFFRVRY